MGFWSAMVWITMICAITVVALAKHGVFRRKSEAVGSHPENAQIAALQAELGRFKERIAVLERITTENDRGLMLDREIEKLRSLPVE